MTVLLLSLLPSPIIAVAQEGGLYTYTYVVRETGWVDITTRFESNSSGVSWVLVPKFQNYSLRVLSGSIEDYKLIENTNYYFYSNYTFSYSKGTALEISWSYRFGALIIEPNGAFFSTQISFNRKDDALVTVILPAEYSVQGVEPKGYATEKEGNQTTVKYYLDGSRNNTMRVLISFKARESSMEERSVGKLTLVYPKRYEDFVRNISIYYEKTLPLIQDITSMKEEIPIKVNLFVPEKMEDITTQGYTGPRYTSDVITQGEVHLNMMLARMPEYELPMTLVHELLHQYMQVAGLGIGVRWMHEGLAQYLSYLIVREIGMNPPEEPNNETASLVMASTGGDLSFLLDWRGGGLPGDPSLYYTASLILVKDLADKYGGYEVYKKLFLEMKKDRATVNSPEDLVRYLNKAIGNNVSEFFRAYSIMISENSQQSSLLKTAWTYVRQTSWFNPFNWYAEKLLKEGSEDSATLAIYVMVMGVLTEALLLAILLGLLTYFIEKRGVVRRPSPISRDEGGSSTSP
ncbi:MAG: hypothetical protein NZ992_04835 [Candidatus Korarchaeum sp.]|nr:hypothetical protein [Candidatus Korarchaeum sp.]MDW8035749.1 hypothetical protein [Candidatus Korarchaeum sp.]